MFSGYGNIKHNALCCEKVKKDCVFSWKYSVSDIPVRARNQRTFIYNLVTLLSAFIKQYITVIINKRASRKFISILVVLNLFV